MPDEAMEHNLENEPILFFEGRTLKPIGLFDKVVIKLIEWVTIFSSLALTIVIVVAAFRRYIVRGDLYGYEEWVKLLAFWLYFMGGAYGAYNDTHVSADLIDAYMPEGRPRQIMIFIRQLITSLMSIAFTCFGYYFFLYGLLGPLPKEVLSVGWNGVDLTFKFIDFMTIRAIARTTVWQIPLWTSYLAIFLGLILMTIFFTRRCIHTGISIIKGFGGREK